MNKYGLIGDNVKYSYSKVIHESFYKKFNIDAQYDLISVEQCELKEVVNKIRNKTYLGFNVTVPYKSEILKYVDKVSDSVLKLNSCNTLKLVDGKVIADNTDVYGFEMLLNYFDIKLNNTFILGSGGSSKSVQYVLDKLNVKYDVISRNTQLNYKFLENNINNHAIINTTPIGMYPDTDKSVVSQLVAAKSSCIVDLIYNPKETLLMSYNKKSFNGLVMLVYQAVKSFEIWTTINVDKNLIEEIIKELEVR